MTDAKVVQRLRELQAGAEPAHRRAGICYDMLHRVGIDYSECGDIFEAMGLHRVYPIGVEPTRTMWADGGKRRKFCGEIADFLEKEKWT